MSFALTVVVVVVSSQPDAAFDASIARATGETLPAGARVTMRDATTPPSDETVLALEATEHADAIAVVTWSDGAGPRATLRMHQAAPPHWLSRDLGFGSQDARNEEGRAIGFALAAMLPEPDETEAAPARSPVRAPEPSAQPSASAHAVVVETDNPANGRATFAELARAHGAIRGLAIAGVALGGQGNGVGWSVEGRYFLGDHFGVRVAGSLRIGDIDPSQADSVAMRAAAGVTWRSADGSRAHPFTYGARADLLAAYLHAALKVNDVDETQARWLPGADALAEASWTFAGSASLVVGAGIETLFGKTDVDVGHTHSAVVPPASALFELGLEAKF